jgi:hypothetical protein
MNRHVRDGFTSDVNDASVDAQSSTEADSKRTRRSRDGDLLCHCRGGLEGFRRLEGKEGVSAWSDVLQLELAAVVGSALVSLDRLSLARLRSKEHASSR